MEILNPLHENGWDQRISQYQEVTIFHTSLWAKVLQATYGYTPIYLVTHTGLLPLMEARSWLTGFRGVSLPFTDECEPMGFDPNSFPECLKRLSAYGKSRNWNYWEIRGGETLMKNASPSLRFHTHALDLRAGETATFEQFEPSVRRAIRKSEKSGVTVQISENPAAMKTFYRLQCRTRQKHGLPVQPWAFFQNIQRHVLSKGHGFLAMASRDGAAIAASLYLVWGKQAIYKFGASDERFQEYRGSNLVMWRAIQHALQLGLHSLHLGRTSLTNEGLRRFKLGWGTTEQTKSYFKFDLRKNAFVTDTDRASGWHNRVFRTLPTPLLQLTGRMLYPHLA